MFDLTDSRSYDKLGEWKTAIEDKASEQGIPVFLVGNKMDWEDDRVVEEEVASEYASENGWSYYEISAKHDDTSKITDMLQDLLEKVQLRDTMTPVRPTPRFSLAERRPQ